MRYYRQVKLKQDAKEVVAWIPLKGSDYNATVEVPELGGKWKVIESYGQIISEQTLKHKQAVDRNCFASLGG